MTFFLFESQSKNGAVFKKEAVLAVDSHVLRGEACEGCHVILTNIVARFQFCCHGRDRAPRNCFCLITHHIKALWSACTVPQFGSQGFRELPPLRSPISSRQSFVVSFHKASKFNRFQPCSSEPDCNSTLSRARHSRNIYSPLASAKVLLALASKSSKLVVFVCGVTTAGRGNDDMSITR